MNSFPGMSSACSNPLLYGWLNNNFRNEFRELFAVLRSYTSKCCKTGANNSMNTTINNNTLNKNCKSYRNCERRASQIYCGPSNLGDEDNIHDILNNGRTKDTIVMQSSINEIPLVVSCDKIN